MRQFTYKDTTIQLEGDFVDESDFAYSCFIEALHYEFSHSTEYKDTGIQRLLNHYNREVWYMDITYATIIATKEEQALYARCIEEINRNISDTTLYSLIQKEYIQNINTIIDGKCTELEYEQYLYNYTSVTLPTIIKGMI